ncbi:MAG TPA: hypothetical protein PLJ35_12060 [Anaerolineae bacterium]|nr:hypothetical protein [Anaerolineae bacterium]HOQ99546.1 hypothetical protein [Anaerolineae bacterium]HPL27852.1 hypothetical protein [Anaerolineae bacterium]
MRDADAVRAEWWVTFQAWARTAYAALSRGPWRAGLAVLLTFGLALVGLAATPRNGDGAQWERIAGLTTAGAVHQVLAGQSDGEVLLYVAVERWGLFRSADEGRSWQRADGHLPLGRRGQAALGLLAAAPDEPQLLLAAVEGPAAGGQPAVYKSRDGGVLWVPRRGLGVRDVEALAIAPGQVAYAASGSRLYRSVDGGDTWLRAGSRPAADAVLALAIDPESGTVAIGTQGDGLWLTADRGASWRSALAGGTVYAIGIGGAGRIYAGAGDGLYASADGGASWQPVPMPEGAGPLVTLAVAPGSPDRLYAAPAGGPLYCSADGGAAWQALRHTLLRSRVMALAVDPRSPRRLYVGTQQGLWRCTLPAEVDYGRDAR